MAYINSPMSNAGSAVQFRDPPDPDLCAKEPIHIPGSIEPSGVLLVAVEPGLTVVQISASCQPILGRAPEAFLNTSVPDLLEAQSYARMESEILPHELEASPRRLLDLRVKHCSGKFEATVHRLNGLTYVELEPASEGSSPGRSYAVLSNVLADLRGTGSVTELCRRAADHVRRLTEFDRVMVYKFLEDDTGCVAAEERRSDLAPYLGLRFPASDIPPQARLLYRRNPLRLKPDVNALPSEMVPAVNPATGMPLDMSYCILRRMSPIHDEYLRNMGVVASMSLSIIKQDRLWGLIACHHTTPKYVSAADRIACELLVQFLSGQISSMEDQEAWKYHEKLSTAHHTVEHLLSSSGDLLKLLAGNPEELTSLLDGGGMAACHGREVVLAGLTPPRAQIIPLIDWLASNQREPVFATDALQTQYAPAAAYADTASGLLSVRITRQGRDFLVWFRPEVLQTVDWAGSPSKTVEVTDGRLGPRRSFALWKETVAGQSKRWSALEKQFASSLRNLVAEALLTSQNNEVNRLNTELSRSNIELDAFAYAAGHDLQEPLRTIHSYAELLQRRSSEGFDAEASELLDFIIDGAGRMQDLIRRLLDYSRLGGTERVKRSAVNLEETLHWVLLGLGGSIRENEATITHDPLPSVTGDSARIGQVFQNLLANALRYRSARAPIIHISASLHDGACAISIKDNGCGFDPRFTEEIFRVFMRLHGRELSGSGVGLAICRKIVEQHGGRIWAESVPGEGSTFTFTLPLA